MKPYPSAARAGLIACRVCGHLQPQARANPERGAPPPLRGERNERGERDERRNERHNEQRGEQHNERRGERNERNECGDARCMRCGARLHRRQPDSLARTWALLLAAALLYIPANLLPVMHTIAFGSAPEDDTIMSGVVYFWTSGDWLLAVIVFVASILVPMLKLSVLALLAFTCQRRSTWRPAERARLYRLVEFIGRWSMLDVFVITLTVALVRFESLAVITAGPGAMAFGSVVILTMLASHTFDPRLIWDPVERDLDNPRATVHDTRAAHAVHAARAAHDPHDPRPLRNPHASPLTLHDPRASLPLRNPHPPSRNSRAAYSPSSEGPSS